MFKNQTNNDIVEVLIEITKGSSVKYEFDQKRGHLVVDRFLHTSMYYPFNYGFIPETIGKDGDPADVLVLTYEAVMPGAFLPVRIIGMLETEDERGEDNKLIAVPIERVEPEAERMKDVLDLTSPTKNRIAHFFEYYKSLEYGKWVKIKKWQGKKEALKYLGKCRKKA